MNIESQEKNICGKILKKIITFIMVTIVLFSAVSFDFGQAYAAKIKAPVLESVTATSTTATVKWKKYEGAKGYVIYRKKGSGKYKKIATVKGNSKTSYTNKKLSSKTKYSYKIKVYKTVKEKTVYSGYSKVKTVQTKSKTTKKSNSSSNSKSSGTTANSNYVWIPRTGSKYHCSSACSRMSNPSKVTIEIAKELGFTACKRCY